ncbi:MAG: ATP-binding cassette domain-containing protein [Chitinivibrionales bacterium]|nr:ATP-binding cassette domain-containing protein [Chitinivibrionales bacterium]MBD3397416.1 ATP-binding cassette domain-containing protein [Chitinivibrionales bacterium]
MVRVEQLKKSFTDDAGTLEVLKGASFSIDKGDMVALVGVSGAGKTTLLQILGGLDSCTSGKVEVDGKDITGMSPRRLAGFRREYIGFVFQFHHLLPDFTAVENVLIPGMILGRKRKECVDRARWLLGAMGLERQAHHFPSELSGGERQRVALARALFNEPALVLADEPTGNLDSGNSRQLLELFHKTNEELKQTFLVATHNEHLSAGLKRNIYIRDGITSNTGQDAD